MEVDHFWDALVAHSGQEGRCAGLRTALASLAGRARRTRHTANLSDPDPARRGRAMRAMLQMKKLNLAAIRAAADGGSLQRLAECQIESAAAEERMHAFLQRQDAMIAQPRGWPPHHDVAVRERHAAWRVGSTQAAEQEHRR